MQRVYLDHNATTPMLPQVRRAIAEHLEENGANPSSVHWHGRRARRQLEAARQAVAGRLGGDPRGLVFTSGATEANNQALRVAHGGPGGAHVITTAVEHPSVEGPCARLEARGVAVSRIPVDPAGRVEAGSVAALLRPETALVSVMLANHETGVIQPVREVAAAARAAGIPVHCDAAQAFGRIPVDVGELGIDLMTVSAHKLGGPPGIGALWVRPGFRLEALLVGGGQESDRRGGTENLLAAVGFGAAASAPMKDLAPLRDRLESELTSAWPGAVVHGGSAPRLPNTTCVGFPGLDGEAAVMRLDLEGVSVSLGSACATGAMRPSPVLRAMGVSGELARGSLRFSLGQGNTAAEIDRAAHVFRDCIAAVPAGVAAGEGA